MILAYLIYVIYWIQMVHMKSIMCTKSMVRLIDRCIYIFISTSFVCHAFWKWFFTLNIAYCKNMYLSHIYVYSYICIYISTCNVNHIYIYVHMQRFFVVFWLIWYSWTYRYSDSFRNIFTFIRRYDIDGLIFIHISM